MQIVHPYLLQTCDLQFLCDSIAQYQTRLKAPRRVIQCILKPLYRPEEPGKMLFRSN